MCFDLERAARQEICVTRGRGKRGGQHQCVKAGGIGL
jgi:hypothetical protein